MRFTVVADYREEPAEGINVVSKTLIDDLRAAGHQVRIFPPERLLQRLPELIADRAGFTIFTHGPGVRTVAASHILRRLSPTRIVWVATRPDLAAWPRVLRGVRTAHAVICNRPRPDLRQVAADAEMIVQHIGIPPGRVKDAAEAPQLWPHLRARGVPIAVHVGHLRRNRGMERLVAIKEQLGDRVEVVVVASPHFEAAPGLVGELEAVGIHIKTDFVPAMVQVYRSADLYLFPVPPEQNGAIELPLSVLEAIACRLPVISTRFGALPEVLGDQPGVQFADPSEFAAMVTAAVEGKVLERPKGLPANLNAGRVTDRILELARQQ